MNQKLLAELIPSKGERIQVLHHTHTYGGNMVTYLVGNPNGNVLFRLIITFKLDLLKNYDAVLQFLYNNVPNIFYSDDIEELPLEKIECTLLSTSSLKSKFQLDNFITSFLI